jgi:hypothetical protein
MEIYNEDNFEARMKQLETPDFGISSQFHPTEISLDEQAARDIGTAKDTAVFPSLDPAYMEKFIREVNSLDASPLSGAAEPSTQDAPIKVTSVPPKPIGKTKMSILRRKRSQNISRKKASDNVQPASIAKVSFKNAQSKIEIIRPLIGNFPKVVQPLSRGSHIALNNGIL